MHKRQCLLRRGAAWRSAAAISASAFNSRSSRSRSSPPNGPCSRAAWRPSIDPGRDSLRYYYLGANWRRRVEHIGAKPAVDLGGTIIV
uniref:CRISPR-associated endonuclease Cas2 n=1 Tax=Chelativorans sp. (strain BNC1) TaxID=266779 RepID=Q11E12_CHESB